PARGISEWKIALDSGPHEGSQSGRRVHVQGRWIDRLRNPHEGSRRTFSQSRWSLGSCRRARKRRLARRERECSVSVTVTWNGDRLMAQMRAAAAARILTAGSLLVAEAKRDYSRSNPRPHDNPAPRGEFPRGRTWNLRDSVTMEPK